jgi:triacylglycerol lipase
MSNEVSTEFPFAPSASGFDIGNAYSLAQVSSLAYKKFEDDETEKQFFRDKITEWKITEYYFFDCKNIFQDAQGMVLADDEKIIVAFRGTEVAQIQDVIADLKLAQLEALGGRVHRGFYTSFSALWSSDLRIWHDDEEIKQQPGIKRILMELLTKKKRPIFVTGHSLGGAMAVLGAAACGIELKQALPELNDLVISLYTYGQPRVGDEKFLGQLEKNVPLIFRVVNNNDVVARIPVDLVKKVSLLEYQHAGKLIYLDTQNNVHEKDLGWFERTKDEFWGRLEDLGKFGTDGIKDHSLDLSDEEENSGVIKGYKAILRNAYHHPSKIIKE